MANQIQQWQIAHASVRGKSHIDAGLPNQDALHLAVSQDQTCFSLVMCDGAGSARFAQEGARHFSRCIGERLLALVLNANENGLTDKHRNQVGDQIVQIIATARQELDLRGATLRDYACNLMAVAMGPQWGLRVHLGDAVLIKCRFAIQPDQGVDYFADTQMTVQDRSEYANETHFLTQHDWKSCPTRYEPEAQGEIPARNEPGGGLRRRQWQPIGGCRVRGGDHPIDGDRHERDPGAHTGSSAPSGGWHTGFGVSGRAR